jgi:hypothetical protein
MAGGFLDAAYISESRLRGVLDDEYRGNWWHFHKIICL